VRRRRRVVVVEVGVAAVVVVRSRRNHFASAWLSGPLFYWGPEKKSEQRLVELHRRRKIRDVGLSIKFALKI
jgi:hypothetical protein